MIKIKIFVLFTISFVSHYYEIKEIKSSEQPINLFKYAKKNFELIDFNFKKDTLELISTSSFLYYPFGKHKSIKDITFSNRENIQKQRRSKDSTHTLLVDFFYNDSYSTFFYNKDSKMCELVKARIINSHVILSNGINLRLRIDEFFNIFFDNFPKDSYEKINVIKLVSGKAGVWHYYHFKNGKLDSINIETDYLFKY
jgi:hypothetical protein